VLVGLRHGAVGLVRARRRDALVLVIDVRGGAELLLERAGAVERRRAPAPVHVADLVGDLDLGVHRDLLLDETHREDRREVLGPGDGLALIPPVSGGSTADVLHARVVESALSLDALVARVRDPRAGAVVTFQGVTREVERLHYEAYVEMAEERIAAIVGDAVARHGLCAAACEHRVGDVPLSEPSVAVAVSAAPRREAFDGARGVI